MAVEVVGAPVRRGKTFWATRRARARIKLFLRKKRKDPSFVGEIFSNYPIYIEGYGYTKVWSPGDEEKPIFDSFIIIDEAHRFYNSRKIKEFTSEMHDFFAWSGQRGNDILLITHDPGRVDKIIREVCEAFYYVRKFSLFGFPILFFVDGYPSEDDYKQKLNRFCNEWFFFSFKVARSYDTHYFRNQPDELPTYQDWHEMYNLAIPEYKKWYAKIIDHLRSLGSGRCEDAECNNIE